jgi:biopolymer transport protein ExbB
MQYLLLGGIFIWPILIEGVIALWIIVERCIYLIGVMPGKSRALDRFAESDEEKLSTNPEPPGVFADAVRDAFRQRRLNLSIIALEAEKLIKETERYFVGLHIIALTAPLFGLLGTVAGMINVFTKIDMLQGMAIQTDFAGGIREALITTEAGLIVGIPALIAYIAFVGASDRFASRVETAIGRIAHTASQAGVEVV